MVFTCAKYYRILHGRVFEMSYHNVCCTLISDKVEKQSVAEAIDYLNLTGGTWPTFDPNWNEKNFDLETSLAVGALHDAYDRSRTVLGPFIRFFVFRHSRKPRPIASMQVSSCRHFVELSASNNFKYSLYL